jgi:hypothetical protein
MQSERTGVAIGSRAGHLEPPESNRIFCSAGELIAANPDVLSA